MKKNVVALIFTVVAGSLLQGCAPSSYKVSAPAVSNIKFHLNDESQQQVSITDNRADSEKTFSYGVLKADLILAETKLDPVDYLKTNTAKELNARGIKTAFVESSESDVKLNKLVMRNHRTNAYTPFITFTMLSADIPTKEGNKRIGVFIKRGKVPVWSFNEIIEPTLNEPLDLLVKEFAAKLNNYLYHAKASDADVQSLIAKINNKKQDKKKYMDVYQLGFSNNPKAIPAIYDLTKSDDEYIRMAAISSLGTLQAQEHFDYLKSLTVKADTWTDRAMALKAIGDLNTDGARQFLSQHKASLESEKDKEKNWSSEIINLYL
ncbi:HEAT repeat domain-containing protein [uncultured Shewanella sp.]|uniref:HEAT repeat domain-containing protein n=1 Tax=uncultured Shewanella sp. TaxID=173975 RepID=UPI0026214204|nr:HEAT repeat domain-containing protein [uncultured Shewanella sp.]